MKNAYNALLVRIAQPVKEQQGKLFLEFYHRVIVLAIFIMMIFQIMMNAKVYIKKT